MLHYNLVLRYRGTCTRSLLCAPHRLFTTFWYYHGTNADIYLCFTAVLYNGKSYDMFSTLLPRSRRSLKHLFLQSILWTPLTHLQSTTFSFNGRGDTIQRCSSLSCHKRTTQININQYLLWPFYFIICVVCAIACKNKLYDFKVIFYKERNRVLYYRGTKTIWLI